jgi:hypothetical protein
MFPFEFSANQTVVALGLSVVAFVFIMRRTVMQRRDTGRRKPFSRDLDIAEPVDAGATIVAEKLEVRLFDFAREIEGRMQTKIAVLDRLIVDADREIIRLEQVLAESRRLGAGLTRGPDAVIPPPADRTAA